MTDKLRVDPIDLRRASDHMVVGVGEYGSNMVGHMDDFTDALSRWRGAASSVALRDVAESWTIRHAQHQRRVSTLSEKTTVAAQQYSSTDSQQAEAFNAVPTLGVDVLARDMGL